VRVARPALPALARYVAALERVWERGMLSNDGPCVAAFQDTFARYTRGSGDVIAASNCDVALTLAIAALKLPAGARALLPSFGHPSTMHALEWNGLQPRFVDVDAGDWCLHAEQLADDLDGASLIVATHMFGVPCDAIGLQELARAHGIALVLDAAHAAATWLGDRHITEYGDVSVVSFGGTKIVTGGEGAIVVLGEEHTAQRFRRLRTYGMDRDGASQHRGLNAKLSELHAALALLTLEELDEQVARRAGLLDSYRTRLAPRADVALQHAPAASRPTPTFFVADFGDARDHVRRALHAEGIESRAYFPPMHLMRRFAGVPRAPLEVTERLGQGLLALPLYSELHAGVVDEVCDVTLAALDGAHSVDG
jgi:dTDP-4-amino-4,6-dideoxygalactose transaminase